MAKATYRMVVNGLEINVGDDIPDLGSLVFVEGGYGKVSFIEGYAKDVAKLPTWVAPGSQATILDNGKISAAGTHESLLRESEIYREIYEQQTRGGAQDE